jgi:hypothetical protein
MMGCELIADGQTDSDNCFGLEPVYRPMPFGDYDDYVNACVAVSEDERRAVIGKLICDRIVSWNATKKGVKQEINAENFNALPAAVGQRLRNLITGQETSVAGETQEDRAKNSEAA